MGWLSIVASLGALSFGIVQAHGYTDLSMAFQTGLVPGVIWLVAVGVFLYRNPVHIDTVGKGIRQKDDQLRHKPAD